MAFGIDFSTVRSRQKHYWNGVLNSIFGKTPSDAIDRQVPNSSKVAVFSYDYAANGGAIGAIKLGGILPNGAIVKQVYCDVLTTFTTAGADAGTLALSIQSANDVVSAIAVSDVSNPWDAGRHTTIIAGAVANYLKLTANRDLTLTLAGQVVTAGKMKVFVKYDLSE